MGAQGLSAASLCAAVRPADGAIGPVRRGRRADVLRQRLGPALRFAEPRANVDDAQLAVGIFQRKRRETLTAHSIEPLPALGDVLLRERTGLPRVFRIECLGR